MRGQKGALPKSFQSPSDVNYGRSPRQITWIFSIVNDFENSRVHTVNWEYMAYTMMIGRWWVQ